MLLFRRPCLWPLRGLSRLRRRAWPCSPSRLVGRSSLASLGTGAAADSTLVEHRVQAGGPVVERVEDERAAPTKSTFEKIKVDNAVVELDGDEMARIVWQMIKEKLIFPFLDMEIDYYDLSVTYRDETNDAVTVDAAKAIQRCHVGIKCGTVTSDSSHMVEYNLRHLWGDPNDKIRELVGGISFKTPITIRNVPARVSNWSRPIVVGAHSLALFLPPLVTELEGGARLNFEPSDDSEQQEVFLHTIGPGSGKSVLSAFSVNKDAVKNFAKASFEKALCTGFPIYLSTSSPPLPEYDELFVEVFDHIYNSHYKTAFAKSGLWYNHLGLSKLVQRAFHSEGGFVWACGGLSGNALLLPEIVAEGFGCPGLVTSELRCPDGRTLVLQAAHGTCPKHYREFRRGNASVSTNPIASIFAWSRGLSQRAKLDGNTSLALFSGALEEACVSCVENGQMSRDLARRVHGADVPSTACLSTEEFVDAIAKEVRVVLTRTPRRKLFCAQDTSFETQAEEVPRPSGQA